MIVNTIGCGSIEDDFEHNWMLSNVDKDALLERRSLDEINQL